MFGKGYFSNADTINIDDLRFIISGLKDKIAYVLIDDFDILFYKEDSIKVIIDSLNDISREFDLPVILSRQMKSNSISPRNVSDTNSSVAAIIAKKDDGRFNLNIYKSKHVSINDFDRNIPIHIG